MRLRRISCETNMVNGVSATVASERKVLSVDVTYYRYIRPYRLTMDDIAQDAINFASKRKGIGLRPFD